MSIPQEVHRARVKLMPCYTRPTKEGLQSIISLIGYVYVGMVKNILARFHPIVLLVEKNPLLFMQQPTEKPPPPASHVVHTYVTTSERERQCLCKYAQVHTVRFMATSYCSYRYATTYVHMYIRIYHINISSGDDATLTVSAIL